MEMATKYPEYSEDYAHLLVKCPQEKKHSIVLINPLLNGRKMYLQMKKVLLDSFLSDKKYEKLCFLTVRSLGWDAQSCLFFFFSVFKPLPDFPSSVSLGSHISWFVFSLWVKFFPTFQISVLGKSIKYYKRHERCTLFCCLGFFRK